MLNMPLLSKRVTKIQPSPTLAITALANKLKSQGKNIISFGAGEPDFDTPDHIKQACKNALDQGFTKYDNVQGNIQFRQAIKNFYKKEYELNFSLDEVMVTVGAKQSLYNLFMATLEEQDEIIIPAPYWVSYIDIVQLTGATPKVIHTDFNSSYKINSEQLEKQITSKTKFFLLNSPSNPTGAIYNKEELMSFIKVLKKYPHVFIVLDDIYEKIIYDDIHLHSMAVLSSTLLERCVLISGLSKAFSMTGWRIGYTVSKNKDIIKAMSKIQSQSTSNATTFVQIAAKHALETGFDFHKKWLPILQERRDYIYNELSSINLLQVFKPQGAFYIFPDISKIKHSKLSTNLPKKKFSLKKKNDLKEL